MCAMSGTLFPDTRQSVLRPEELYPADRCFAGENQEHGKAYEACTQALHVHPTLERLLKKQPAGKVNLPERQREGALGHIPLCPEDADRSRKGAAG